MFVGFLQHPLDSFIQTFDQTLRGDGVEAELGAASNEIGIKFFRGTVASARASQSTLHPKLG